MPDRYRIDWFAGASALVELFSSGPLNRRTHQLKYTPPFRTTIRPPLEEIPLGQSQLDSLNQRLNEFVASLDNRSTSPGVRQSHDDRKILDTVELLGQQLLTLIIPPQIQHDLSSGGLFLELGMDEGLLSYPWELMNDGKDFLCLKHAIGRYVNGAQVIIPMLRQPAIRHGSPTEGLSMLLISVPNPQPRRKPFQPLPEAEAETKAICEVLAAAGIPVETIIQRDATYDAVFQALRSKPYHIVHFNGHARFDDEKPYRSSLVLYDRDMSAYEAFRYISQSPPILCFLNACETTKMADPSEWKSRYDIYGLGRAFLDTGAYLLGSRWKVGDETAAAFAKCFYSELLALGKPLGTAVLEARKSCRQAVSSNPFGWASYIFYGDPRLCFQREHVEGTPDSGEPKFPAKSPP